MSHLLAAIDIRQGIAGVAAGPTIETTTAPIIARVVNGAILVGALLFLIYLIIGGINWITAGGDKSKIEKAREQIVQAFLGLLILVAAFTLYLFVLSFLHIDLGQSTPAGSSTGGEASTSQTGGTNTPSTGFRCGPTTDGQTVSDSGAGHYCTNGGAAMVKCFAPGEGTGIGNYHVDPCSCNSGSPIAGYNFDAC